MIRRHNAKQCVLAMIGVMVGVVIYVVTFWFFAFVIRWLGGQFQIASMREWAAASSVTVLVVLTISGWNRARAGLGGYGFGDSSFHLALDESRSGAWVVNESVNRVTGPAYLLSQFFLAGPLLILGAWQRLRTLVANEPGLENRLGELLSEIDRRRRWEPVETYSDRERELLSLIRMGRIAVRERDETLQVRIRLEYQS